MEIINRKNVKSFVTKDTSEIRELLSYRNSSIKNQSLAEATVYPGKSTEEHYHPKTEEIYYILSGKALMIIESEEKNVSEGDAIVIMPGKRHKLINNGANPVVLLCCCAPCYEHEDTVIAE